MEQFNKGDTVEFRAFFLKQKRTIKGFIVFNDAWFEYHSYRILQKNGKFIDVMGGHGSNICTCRIVLIEKVINFERHMMTLDGDGI